MIVVDQTPLFLIEDEGGLAIRKDSGWLTSWEEVLAALGRYPWPNLGGPYVDPSVAANVWRAVQDYRDHAGRPARTGALERWRSACRNAGVESD